MHYELPMRSSKQIDPFAPSLWLTRTAASFTQRHPSAITRAARNGELPIAGRNGKSLVFRAEDVKNWFLGNGSDKTAAATEGAARPARATAPSADALARIEAARRGGGR